MAVVQLAITLGGLLFGVSGYRSALAATRLVGSAVASVAAARLSIR